MLTFPDIDPVVVAIGPLAIRWYSLAYIVGIIAGCWYIGWLAKKKPRLADFHPFDRLMVWGIIGIIIGGRLGYVLFYNSDFYFAHPLEAIKIWRGGMAFHGGLLGLIVALWFVARKEQCSFLQLTDLCACAAPIGVFFGRIANFINGELYGRITDVPWAMVFPDGGPYPRHPSQLYEALAEGFFLFVVLFLCARYTRLRRYPGVLSGFFLMGYGIARMVLENYRQPDLQLGLLTAGLTMGQWLSIPMVALGIILISKAMFVRQPINKP